MRQRGRRIYCSWAKSYVSAPVQRRLSFVRQLKCPDRSVTNGEMSAEMPQAVQMSSLPSVCLSHDRLAACFRWSMQLLQG